MAGEGIVAIEGTAYRSDNLRQPRLRRVYSETSPWPLHDTKCRFNPVEIDRENTGPSREDILNKPCPNCGCPSWGRH